VLGNPTGLPRSHFRLPNGVEQAGLSVVHVAHYRDHRRPREEIFLLFFLGNVLDHLLFKRHHGYDAIEGFRKACRRRRVQRLVDRSEDAAVE